MWNIPLTHKGNKALRWMFLWGDTLSFSEFHSHKRRLCVEGTAINLHAYNLNE